MRPDDRTSRKRLGLAAVLTLLLAQAPAAHGWFRQAAPFKISSFGTPFGVQVEVEGTYVVTDHYVEVDVDRAHIYVSEHCPYKGRRLINTLAVGLATTTRRGWEIENRSLPLPVERVLGPREEYRLAGLHFRIPRDADADIEKRWLVVETEEIDLDAPADDEGQAKGYAFAHSCKTLFASPCAEHGR